MVAKVQVVRGAWRIGPIPNLNPRTAGAPTTPFVVVGQERAAILEPGEESQALPLLQAIEELGIDRNLIAYVCISHLHGHHAEGINVLVKETPAKVVCHQRGVPHLLDPTRLNASMDQVWGLEGGYCARVNPVPEDRLLGCSGGEVIDLGGRELEIIDARGHAPHHICVFDRLTQALWTGDLAGQFPSGSEQSNADILPPIHHVAMYIDSFHCCRALKPSVLFSFSAGGGVNWDADKTLRLQEEQLLALASICREGMKNGLTAKEIGQKCWEYEERAFLEGRFSPIMKRTRAQTMGGELMRMWGALHARKDMEPGEHEAPFGLLAYLKKEDPSLPWPKGMQAEPGAGRGF